MRRVLRLSALACVAAVQFHAWPTLAAGGLSVSPVGLTFDAAGQPQVLEVSNPGAADTEVQVRLFAWTQVDGEDRLAPSADIGFSPPMFRLSPGAKQVVRLAPTASVGERETAYRLLVDQLPEEALPGSLQMPIRMALPVFVAGAGAGVAREAKPSIAWRVSFDAASGRARLLAVNLGSRRVKVMELAYVAGGDRRPIASGLAGYVLAGSERGWAFDYSGRPQALDLVLLLDGEPISVRAEPIGS